MACWGSNRSDSRGRSSRAIKFEDFWLEHLFPIFFFGTFCNFLAISLQNSFFLLFFLFLVKRTINLVFLFLNFQGFTLLPWQKVGGIWLEITQIFKCLHFVAISLQNSPFFFLPSCQSNDKFGIFFSNFQGFTLVPWQKVGRIWKKSRYLWHLLRYLKNSYRFRIRFQIGCVWAPQNDRSLNIRYPDFISTHSIFKTFKFLIFGKIHLKIKHLHFLVSTQLVWFTFFLNSTYSQSLSS